MQLEYKNININYTISGKGSTIILLHGFLETLDMWKNLVTELSQNHQVICIDLLGHGKTDCIGYIHTMEDMADAVLVVLEHLKIKKAKCIGHSMGGYVSLALAEKQPQLFEGLCLMNSTFEADDNERKDQRSRAIKMAHTNYENLVRMSFANLFAPESKIRFKKEFEAALKIALQIPLQGYIAAQEGMKLRPNRFEIFKNLKGKKLIITGEKDSLISSEKIAIQIKNSMIIHKELSEGHMSYIENISELTYILKHFIEK
ncbi:alpha/beta fold hydrolase [Winogradskyella sp. PG-2]|uniref:alpha/beta fold hydrolase n=1 Tax=Winogradskyella sp. PG-2 TaxID=754409 RepID=UPI000458929E|nr:alpha/beta hydrolase [Winogradskyella sp. PG-2]BAO75410.1 beta-ketoadipate enol-lactone hydrolase [Winogradskyella sp. PG-2]